ncbi:hypothetical protein LAZ67_7003393 [Cordylochernes scorpioides]|uniref:HTH CENPB-type domain-containing protein n=1 Tax=Cordylochernes scorpioides TaxID=51811 RepID=A0ABY6KP90_9ARAC|nr:hypothetical protein LAZ67_7003393 [Cordylochernes scorpioides]
MYRISIPTNNCQGGRRRSRDIIRVDSIDNEGHLGVRRLNAVLVPKDLTFDKKNARKETASLNLEATTDDPELLKRVITGDETWIYGFDSETTQQVSEWRFKNEPRPKKARKASSKVKVMLTVFFDYQDIVHHEFQQQGSTINADSYLGVLRNTQPLCSPNPLQSRFGPLRLLPFWKAQKKKLKGRKFQSIEEIKVESKKAMKAIPKTDYQSQVNKEYIEFTSMALDQVTSTVIKPNDIFRLMFLRLQAENNLLTCGGVCMETSEALHWTRQQQQQQGKCKYLAPVAFIASQVNREYIEVTSLALDQVTSPDISPSDIFRLMFLRLQAENNLLTCGGVIPPRAKAKTSFQDDDVPIDDTTTKPLFTPQEKGRKGTRDKVPRLRWNLWQKHIRSIFIFASIAFSASQVNKEYLEVTSMALDQVTSTVIRPNDIFRLMFLRFQAENNLLTCGGVYDLDFSQVENPLYENVDKAVNIWYESQRLSGVPIRGIELQTAASHFASKLNNTTFKASGGWLSRYRARHNLKNKRVVGEAFSADEDAANRFKDDFHKLMTDKKYELFQIYNADETGVYWKSLPDNSQVKNANSASGHKQSKDRLSVLLCANADASHKNVLAVVGKSKRPRAIKNIIDRLPVHYYSSHKAWFNQSIFSEWFFKRFINEVRNFQENKLRVAPDQVKALLLVDNSPAHPTELISNDGNIKCKFLPPNTTSVLQPMD